MISYSVKRGSTLNISIEQMTGAPGDVTNVVAKMKPYERKGSNVEMPGPEVAAISLSVSTLEPSVGFNGGWLLTLSNTQTQNLSAGLYLLDLAYSFEGKTYIDGPVAVKLENSAAGG